jgi:hypothetical protein
MHLTRPACLGLCSNQSRTPHRTVGAGRRLATLPARRAGSRHHGYYITSPGARSRYLTAAAADPLFRSRRAMDAGGGLAAGSHMRDELHVMRASDEVCVPYGMLFLPPPPPLV